MKRMSIKLNQKILWSPYDADRFVVGSFDLLRIFAVDEDLSMLISDPEDKEVLLEDNHSLISVCTDIRTLLCIDWKPYCDGPDVVAVGDSDGTISLVSFGNDTNIVKEFVLQQRRSCNALAWNKQYDHLLAAGYVKHRDVKSTIIWDINRQGAQSFVDTGKMSHRQNSTTTRVTSPLTQVPTIEATVDLSWVPSSPSCIATGAKSKFLRFFDIRSSNLDPYLAVQAHSRSVFGVKFNPFDENYLLTFSENIIKFWDYRKIGVPVSTLETDEGNITHVDWCPTMKDTIATSTLDSNVINVWNLDSQSRFSLISSRRYNWDFDISSFSWHPTDKLSIILAGGSRDSIKKSNLFYASPIGVSTLGEIGLVSSKSNLLFEGNPLGSNTDISVNSSADISALMYNRAKMGYSSNLARNLEIVPQFHSKEISSAWTWINNFQKDRSEEADIPGINRILSGGLESKKKIPKNIPKVLIYCSVERTMCQKICGWDFYSKADPTAALNNQLDELMELCVRNGDYSRAAALAVFNNAIPKAINVLVSVEADPESKTIFTLVGLALAGYNDENDNVTMEWKKNSIQIKTLFNDPYLESIFTFLSTDKNSMSINVLSPDISLTDKIAFSCRYLSDDQLSRFLQSETVRVLSIGNLEGLVITGMDHIGGCIKLLQNYIDRTCDIQTVVLLLSKLGRNPQLSDVIQTWTMTYRELLNQWQLWFERTRFDVHKAKKYHKKRTPLIVPTCGECGNAFFGQQTKRDVLRIEANCVECGSSLPCCSLCLLPVFSPQFDSPDRDVQQMGSNISFTWCQSCGHGGHIQHINDWFETHPECPESLCDCLCFSI